MFPTGVPDNKHVHEQRDSADEERNERARIGLPTTPAILLFVAACVGIIAPAARAMRM
jgi:hypothetical protein